MFIDVAVVHVVEMAVVQVVNMVAVFDGRMAAAGAMCVCVV